MQVAALMLVSALLISSALGILVWALGWGVLLVLGAGFAAFVLLSVARDAVRDSQFSRRK